ncbi:MAG: hypothetical protein FWC75_05465 [Oscillospiraceae bacterium]|nr:hypothetical protein [Oscillospiraceae bacterium]
MLTINAKFVANELTPGLENGTYCIADGSSVTDLIKQCERQSGASIPDQNYQYMYPMFNGKAIRLDSPLIEDGTLHLCRIVMGG